MRRIVSRLKLILLALLLSACGELAPAAPVSVLSATPGAGVVVADEVYESSAFTVSYPPGWTVVTSAAFTASYAVFISPDERVVLALALNPDDIAGLAPPVRAGELTHDSAAIDGLSARIVAPTGIDTTEIFAAFVASVRVRP